MSCKNFTIRSRKGCKYKFCRLYRKEINYEDCKECQDKEYKKYKRIKGKKHKRTKATDIQKRSKRSCMEQR